MAVENFALENQVHDLLLIVNYKVSVSFKKVIKYRVRLACNSFRVFCKKDNDVVTGAETSQQLHVVICKFDKVCDIKIWTSWSVVHFNFK